MRRCEAPTQDYMDENMTGRLSDSRIREAFGKFFPALVEKGEYVDMVQPKPNRIVLNRKHLPLEVQDKLFREESAEIGRTLKAEAEARKAAFASRRPFRDRERDPELDESDTE